MARTQPRDATAAASVDRLAELPARLVGLLAAHSRAAIDATLSTRGLRLLHVVVLEAVGADDGVTQRHIGAVTGLDCGNLVELLDDLEERGAISRRRDPNDRRRHIVELTARGARDLDWARARVDSATNDTLGGLSARERRELIDLTQKALRHLGVGPSTCPSTLPTERNTR
jgi:DNA-binding MarR family transcriptional regulator